MLTFNCHFLLQETNQWNSACNRGRSLCGSPDLFYIFLPSCVRVLHVAALQGVSGPKSSPGTRTATRSNVMWKCQMRRALTGSSSWSLGSPPWSLGGPFGGVETLIPRSGTLAIMTSVTLFTVAYSNIFKARSKVHTERFLYTTMYQGESLTTRICMLKED